MSQRLSRHTNQGLSYLRGGSGTPLLLLHGIPGSANSWEKAGQQLSSHYDVIIPDLKGFGESDCPEHFDHDLYMEAHADAVHRLLVALDVRQVFLGGHDFGGSVALTLLRLFPELEVEGLVLSATNAFTDPYVPVPFRFARVPVLGSALFRLIAGTRLGLRLLYWMGTYDKSTFSAADFAHHLTPSGIEQTRQILHRSLADLTGQYEHIEALLSDLSVPTLALWGERDPFFPIEHAKRLVNTLPYATLTILEETGHFVPEERPKMTAWHMDDFLRAPAKWTGKTSPRRPTS